MISRRAFLGTVAGGLLAAPLAGEAQQAGKRSRVGLLDPMSPSIAAPFHDEFRRGLRQLGYLEGRSIVIEYRFAEGKVERLPKLAAELVRDKVDVIVAGAAPAVHAAQRATSMVPIVMVAYGADPVEAGLVAAWRTQGGTSPGRRSSFPS